MSERPCQAQAHEAAARLGAAELSSSALRQTLGHLRARAKAALHRAEALAATGPLNAGKGATDAPEAVCNPVEPAALDPLVMHVVVRADLITDLGWSTGSVIAQGAHASVAVIHEHYADPWTKAYLDDLGHMRKVTVQVKGQTQLLKLSDQLTEQEIDHHLWMELPEQFPTAIATKPRPKSSVPKVVKKLKLFKDAPQKKNAVET